MIPKISFKATGETFAKFIFPNEYNTSVEPSFPITNTTNQYTIRDQQTLATKWRSNTLKETIHNTSR